MNAVDVILRYHDKNILEIPVSSTYSYLFAIVFAGCDVSRFSNLKPRLCCSHQYHIVIADSEDQHGRSASVKHNTLYRQRYVTVTA